MIEDHWGLLHVVVSTFLCKKKYLKYKHLREEFMSIAAETLVKAAHKYDPDRGVLFKTYASRCIMGELFHAGQELYQREGREVHICTTNPNLLILSTPDFTDKYFKDEEPEDDRDLIELLAPEDPLERQIYYLNIIEGIGIDKVRVIVRKREIIVRAIRNKILKDLKDKYKSRENLLQGDTI